MKEETQIPHLTIPFTAEQINGIASMGDFYQVTGLEQLVKEKTITTVNQVWMSRKQCEDLEEIVFRNLKKTKRFRGMSEKYILNAVAMDWLNYSPSSADYIPEWELWVFTPQDADLFLEEHRERIKKESKKK